MSGFTGWWARRALETKGFIPRSANCALESWSGRHGDGACQGTACGVPTSFTRPHLCLVSSLFSLRGTGLRELSLILKLFQPKQNILFGCSISSFFSFSKQCIFSFACYLIIKLHNYNNKCT